MNSKETICLNVRGFKYEVLLDSLANHPNTRLGMLRMAIKKQNSSELSRLCDRFNSDLNEFYFNRDPFVLNMILNYHVTNKLHMNHKECVCFLKDELDYWQIDEYDFHSCCQVVYLEKTEYFNELKVAEKDIMKKYRDDEETTRKRFFRKERNKIWNLFDDPDSSIYAKILFYFSISVIIFSIILLIAKTDPMINYEENPSLLNNSEGNGDQVKVISNVFTSIDLTIIIWFLTEFFIRLTTCPSLFKFFASPLNILDIASSLPTLIFFILPTTISPTLKESIRILRILLLLKIARYSKSLKTLIQSLKKCYKEFLLSLVFFAIGMVFFSTFMYYCEKDTNFAQFNSIYDTFWWAVVTMTTLGYGDIRPTTPQGKTVASFCAVYGLLILAMPTSIISSSFSILIAKNRHRKYLRKSRSVKI